MPENSTSRLILEQPSNNSAANRSRIYALFAEALTYPEGANALRLLDGDWLGDLEDALSALGDSPGEILNVVPSSDLHDVQALKTEYSRLFDVGSGTPMISMLERRYVEVPEQELWQRLLAFYSHFGLDFSDGYAAEQPDHLLTELSFMHYLSFLEAGAKTSAEDIRRGQHDFLEQHLSLCCVGIDTELETRADTALYIDLLRSLVRFVTFDYEHLKLQR